MPAPYAPNCCPQSTGTGCKAGRRGAVFVLRTRLVLWAALGAGCRCISPFRTLAALLRPEFHGRCLRHMASTGGGYREEGIERQQHSRGIAGWSSQAPAPPCTPHMESRASVAAPRHLKAPINGPRPELVDPALSGKGGRSQQPPGYLEMVNSLPWCPS